MSQNTSSEADPNTSSGSEAAPKLGPVRQRVRPALPPSDIRTDPAADVAPPNYAVGYGKPPRHTQFKPGRSGNPKGRPKGAIGLNTIVKSVMTEKRAVSTGKGSKKMTRIEIHVRKTDERAKTNQAAASKLIDLYAKAVPETPEDNGQVPREIPLTESDRKILDLYAARIRSEEGGS